MGSSPFSHTSFSFRYIAGRLKIISNEDAKGLNTFIGMDVNSVEALCYFQNSVENVASEECNRNINVLQHSQTFSLAHRMFIDTFRFLFTGTFALPSLIFTSLVQLDWSTVNWLFLLAILIAKSIIFFGVGIVSLLMTASTTSSRFGRAGILAIFCTQSNDFAIGAPIVAALYHKAHPDYGAYLYLMAPLSLAILNPIGYILLELSSVKKSTMKPDDDPSTIREQIEKVHGPSKKHLVLEALKSIVTNPILFMTVFGVIGGFLLKDGLPPLAAGVLNVFGNAFSATALFSLGLRMVDSTKHFHGPQLLTPIVLILMKEYV